MPKINENGRFSSLAVEHIGDQFNIWRFDRKKIEYEVFDNRRDSIAIVFADEDAENIRVGLAKVDANHLTKQAFEAQLASMVEKFLASI